MLLFWRYRQKLIAYFDKICESVKLDSFLRFFVILTFGFLCFDGAILAVRGEVISVLIRADVPFVWFGLLGFSLSCVVVAWVNGRSYWFHLILLQLFLVSYFILGFEAVYIFIRHSPKIVNGQQVGEVVSADSSYIALFLILAGLSVMIGYCASERVFKLSSQMIVGILAIVGILLPDILSSYRVVKTVLSGCGDNLTCGDETILSSLSLIESTLAAAAALAMLFFLSSFLVPYYARRYFRKCVDLATGSDLSSENSHNLLNCDGASVSAVSSVMSDGSAEEVNAMEGFSSSPYVVAGSKQLMSVAVGGLVAGACFSIASRLFGRR